MLDKIFMKKTNKQKEKVSESKGRIFSGVVVSNKMKDTTTVLVKRFVKHPKYGKFIKSSKKYKAHDPMNTKNIGDKVSIRETKPISKDKRFMII